LRSRTGDHEREKLLVHCVGRELGNIHAVIPSPRTHRATDGTRNRSPIRKEVARTIVLESAQGESSLVMASPKPVTVNALWRYEVSPHSVRDVDKRATTPKSLRKDDVVSAHHGIACMAEVKRKRRL
jgi:hypothetical protein